MSIATPESQLGSENVRVVRVLQGSFQAHASEQKIWLALEAAICFSQVALSGSLDVAALPPSSLLCWLLKGRTR